MKTSELEGYEFVFVSHSSVYFVPNKIKFDHFNDNLFKKMNSSQN
jgi:hypothetical protein